MLNKYDKQLLSGPECQKFLKWLYDAIEKDGLVGMDSHRFKPSVLKGKTLSPNSNPEKYVLNQSEAYGVKPEEFAKVMNSMNDAVETGNYKVHQYNDSPGKNYARAMSVIK